MKRSLFTTLALCLSLAAWAQATADEPTLPEPSVKADPENLPEPDGAGGFITMVDGPARVSVNAFGRAGQTSPGCAGVGTGFIMDTPDSVMCEHTDFLSTGGQVMAINEANCQVLTPATLVNPQHAISSVVCGTCQVNFHHALDGIGGQTWQTAISIYENGGPCRSGCYYTYTDYDVNGFSNNGGSWRPGPAGSPYGQFLVRNNVVMPGVKFMLSDASFDGPRASSHGQGEFPSVRTQISGFQQCLPLSNGPATFSGDWTGALMYRFAGPGTEEQPHIIRYNHSRNDALAFP